MTILRTLLAALLLGGCASVPPVVDTPMLLVGTVTEPHATGWALDHCGDGNPVLAADRRVSDTCIPHGGELYAATLAYPRPPGGASMTGSLEIAFPGHGIPEDYSATHAVVLQPSPADFEAATGISLVVAARDNFDAGARCLVEVGLGHLDGRYCRDPEFHARHRGQCLPLPAWLAHYAAGR